MESARLGDYVAERRKTLGLRQSDLAESLGYTTQAICSFEMGKSQLSVLLLPNLANNLCESLDDLLACNPNPSPFVSKNPKADPSLLTRNLVALRKKDGLSLDQEAVILGVNKRTVTNYEKGLTTLALSCLLNLLKHDNLKASDFFYHELIPVIPAPTAKSRFHWLPFSLFIILSLGVVTGSTSPLWAAKAKAAALPIDSALISSTSSSAPSSSSNKVGSSGNSSSGLSSSSGANSSSSSSATSSSSPSSSPASSSSSSSSANSSSSVDQSGYLSPYLPGLKLLDVYDDQGHASGATISPGSFAVSFDSGAFTFSEMNAYIYRFEFLLIGAPTGVSLNDKNYLSRTLTVGNDTPDKSVFSVQIKAYAVSHEDEPCYSAPFRYVVYNPATEDATESLPGLTSIGLLVNGASSEEQFLMPGDYTIGLKCVPENYLSLYHASVTYSASDDGSNVSLKGQTLTVHSTAPEYPYFMNVSIFNDLGCHTFIFPIIVKNTPPAAAQPYYFPSLRGIYLSFKGYPCLRSKGGEYDIDIAYEMEEGVKASFDASKWIIRIQNGNCPTDALFDFNSLEGPIHLSLPPCTNVRYETICFYVFLCPRNDMEAEFRSDSFYILLGA